MKAKKIAATLMAMTLAATALAGCGSSSGSTGTATDSNGGDGTVSGSLNIWYNTYSYEKGLDAVIEAFNAEYPDVDVQYEIKADGDYDSLLKTAIQSGDGPDLFWTNGTATSTMPDLAENGAIADLTDDVDYSFISEDALEIATVDDKQYSVPWMNLDTRAVFYNKDMFEENGWELPTTFSEFEELLGTIKDAGITPISLSYDSWCMLFAFEPILSGYDAEYSANLSDYSVKATDAPAREAMQKMVDWAEAGYFGDNWFGVTDSSTQNLAFTTGACAMNIAGSWDIENISMNNPNLNFGAFEIPAEDGTTGMVGTVANGLSVSADSKNLDAAVAFANFCATKEAQTAWVQALGAVSATTEIESTSEVAQEITESSNGNIYRSWQNVLSSYSEDGEASNIWAEEFPDIFTGEMTVDQLMDDIAAVMQ